MNIIKLFSVVVVGCALSICGAEKGKEKKESSAAAGVSKKSKAEPHVYPEKEGSSVERLDGALDSLIAPDAKVEKLASGFEWAEGPVWIAKGDYLLFSDVPRNIVFRWKEGEPTSEFIMPSGYTASTPRGGEIGSNGLTVDSQGRLVLCQHGNRQVARREANGKFTPLAQYYNYRKFNSPNDLVFKKNGDLYFTDPPYGLEKNTNDPLKELNFQGVYRVTPQGKVELMIRDLTRPNGLAFSPDEKLLYVCVSDPAAANIWVYDVDAKGIPQNGRIFFNAQSFADKGGKGLPDGMKVDLKGNLFASCPGGIFVISPEAKLLGIIKTGEKTANCAWGNDGSVLYMTADHFLCRIKTLTKGAIPGGKQ